MPVEPRRLGAASGLHAKQLVEPLRGQVRSLTAALVQTATVQIPPNGNEAAGQAVLRSFFESQQIESEQYSIEFVQRSGHRYARCDRNYRDRHNLAVHLPGAGPGRSLLLTGHIDTVPEGKGAWRQNAWAAHEEHGRLYGLGSFDMKSGLAAQAIAIAALHRDKVKLAGDLFFESVVDEEWGGGGGTLAAMLRGVRTDAAVISEGTQLEIYRATRGGFVVDLVVRAGDPSAYFSNTAAVSPALPLSRILGWIERWVKSRATVESAGAYALMPDPAPVQVLAIEANRLDCEVPLSVPLEATVRIYFQFLPDEDVPGVLAAVRASLEEFRRADPFFREHEIQWKPLYEPALLGHEVPEGHPWTQCLAGAVESVRERRPGISGAPYPCDAFLLHREFGIPTLLFGPAGGGAHNPNEYVELTSVVTTAESLVAAALEWCA